VWVWLSIRPGSTVALERSIRVPPGGNLLVAASVTLSIRLPRITITWLRRGESDLPSISTPARITVTGRSAGELLASCATEVRQIASTRMQQRNMLMVSSPRLLSYVRIGLNFYQNFGRDQGAHLNHGSGRTNFAKNFSVSFADFLPVGDIGDKHARADDVIQAGTGLLQSRTNVLQGLHGLRVYVTNADDIAIRSCGRGARHMDVGSDFYRARIADYRLPGRTTGNVLPLHCSSRGIFHCIRQP